MTTYATTSIQRPKKLVKYGKSTSRSTWSTKHVDGWLDENDSDVEAPSAKRVQTVKATYQVQKPAAQEQKKQEPAKLVARPVQDRVHKQEPAKTGPSSAKPISNSTKPTARPARPAPTSTTQREKSRDLFDVPTSEEESEEEVVLKRPTPPKARHIKALVDDSETVEALAPWEHKAAAATSARAWKGNVSPEAQLKSDLAMIVNKSGRDISNAPAQAHETRKATTISVQEPSTAAAKLAARRLQTAAVSWGPSTTVAKPPTRASKRSDAPVEATLVRPTKRRRKVSPPLTESEDTVMTDAPPQVNCQSASFEGPNAEESLGIYDFPADEDIAPRQAKVMPKPAAKKDKRRAPSSSARATPVKGLSAPARLAEMLPVDTDSTDAPSSSPSVLHSRTSTPRRSATPANGQRAPAPPRGATSSLSPAAKASGTLTPKQAQLWSQLLPSDPPAPTPSSLAMKDLRLGARRRPVDKVPSLASTMAKSKSDVPEMHTRRVRLVDRMKAAASSSDSDSSEEDSDTGEDVVMSNSQSAAAKGHGTEQKVAATQSQSQATAESGPKITYARTRSYLPEDNPEDALLFGLPALTPAKPAPIGRQASRTNAASQKSAFDLDDSDDEASTGRMRTIHELRAAGRNNRFMQETETLLEDISQNSSSGRSRRRSALAELATKLMDKAYAERFCGQGFDRVLVNSITTSTRDLVADVLAMAAVALLLLAEPPEHTVTYLKERGIIADFAYMLSEEADFGKLVKERKHNIAKATQSTFASFASTMLGHDLLWGDSKPAALSPRVLALKTLDLLVGGLRRLGDRAELLDEKQLQLVLPESASEQSRAAADTGLAISVLEVLSSSALRLHWPEDLLQRLAALLSSIGEEDTTPKHSVFLALRLTLNLTNDNARNCDIFASQETTIRYLLTSVQYGFTVLESTQATTDTEPSTEQDTLAYDLLVLSMGSMINLAEHSLVARQHTIGSSPTKDTLSSLLIVFDRAQDRIENAESLTESSTNVAFGYLAVMLANLCLDAEVKDFVANKLPGKHLGLLIESVEEFVKHHERVDALGFEGAEGREVWGAFTEKLRGVLGRLKGAAGVADA